MTKVPRTLGRLARRPTGAARITVGLLAAMGLAAAAAPAHAVELPQLADVQSGGTAAPAVSAVDSGGAAAPEEANAPSALPAEAEALGGAVAPASPTVVELAPAELPAPSDGGVQAPAEAAAPPDSGGTSTQGPLAGSDPAAAPPPAAPVPASPAPAGNVNVNIRIFSPGDDGDVVQHVTMPAVHGGALRSAASPREGGDWNWDWRWTCAGGGGDAVAASWNWNWDWDCGATDALTEGLAEAPWAGAEMQAPPNATAPTKPRPKRAHSSVPEPRAAGLGSPAIVTTAIGRVAVAAKPAARTRAVERSTPAGARDGGPSQRLFWQPLVGSAASTAPPGGSPSLLLLVLLAAMALLAPRAVEPAWVGARRLRSLIATDRLERPG